MFPTWCSLLLLTGLTTAMDNLNVAFEWKKLDFNMASDQPIPNISFIDTNNVPYGLEVYGDRIFLTIPRFKEGVPASLAYIKLSDVKESPKLHPYPNLEAHNLNTTDAPPQIVSPYRIRADNCGRLWVVDLGKSVEEQLAPVRLIIYDLHNDELLRSYEIPSDQIRNNSFLDSIAVEDTDCQDTYAYIAYVSRPGLIVYSWKKERSWLITHNFFHVDPLAGNINVLGVNYDRTDGIYGLALSGPNENNFSTLYFHPFNSFNEFQVSTEILRNETAAGNSYHNYRILGNRGKKSQSGFSFYDKKSKVLFYSLVNLNAVACWKTTNSEYTMESQGRIFMSNISMVFPNDIKVDGNDNLWVLSNRLPLFFENKLNFDEVNFRILTAKVNDAIRGTTCDSKLVVVPTIYNKIMPVLNNTVMMTPKKSGAISRIPSLYLLFSLLTVTMFAIIY